LALNFEPDLNGGTSHTASVYVFLKNRVPNAQLGSLQQLVNSLNPKHPSGYALFNPPLRVPPFTCSLGCTPKSGSLCPKHGSKLYGAYI